MSNLANPSILHQGTVTIEAMKQAGINLSDIDQKVTILRPDNNPLLTMLSQASKIPTGSVDFKTYESGAFKNLAILNTAVDDGTAYGVGTLIDLGDYNDVVKTGDTLICQGVLCYVAPSSGAVGTELILLVIGKEVNGQPAVVAVNGTPSDIDPAKTQMIAIPAGTVMHVFGSSFGELDISAPAAQNIPQSGENYCQSFKHQVMESTWQALTTNKEVKWGMAEFMDDALFDFLKKKEQTMLFGVKSKVWNPRANDGAGGYHYTTAGLRQFVGIVDEDVATTDSSWLIDQGKRMFANNNGSKSRVWFVGDQFLAEIMKNAEYTKNLNNMQTELYLGVEVNRINLGFGDVRLVHHKGMNDIGRGDCLFSVDMQNVRKRVFSPMEWLEFDLRKSMQKDADARVLSEVSGFDARNAPAHAFLRLRPAA